MQIKKEMKQLTILCGVSGSGKSTYAHDKWETDPKNIVIVSRDKIRELLFGYTENTIVDYYKSNNIMYLERQVSEYIYDLILYSLSKGKKVIVDNTHLKKSYIEEYSKFNVDMDLIVFNTSMPECIQNDLSRTRQVGVDVIKKQYKQFKSLLNTLDVDDNFKGCVNYKFENKVVPYKPLKGLQECIVVDIDGTIADNQGLRSPFDWHKVDQDITKDNVVSIVKALKNSGYNIVICTGRDGEAEDLTKKWLYKNDIHFDGFYMRKKGDNRKDYIVKEEMWNEIKKVYNIVMMFDDRTSVIRHARSLGYTVADVAFNTF